MDDLEVTVNTDTVDRAAEEARDAANQANMATAMAVGASNATASLVGAVMEAGREDATRAAIEAEQAAQESESAATDAIATNVAVLAQFQQFQSTLLERLDCIERKIDSKGQGSESENTEESVIPIQEEPGREEKEETHSQKRHIGRSKRR